VNVGYPTLGTASIPGDPDGLDAIVGRLRDACADVARVRDRVAANGLQSWSGQAADRFRFSLNRFPGELSRAVAAFDTAAAGVGIFTRDLTGLQERATDYTTRIREHEEEAAAAQHRHDEAQSNLDAARAQQAKATDPAGLKVASDAVEVGLGLWRGALNDLEEHRGEIESLRRLAHENREQYESAVRVCCRAVEDAEATVGSIGFPG
jgi:DNA repair exonuclease SbcCD ATPase subunit